MALLLEIAIETTAIAAGFSLVWNQQRVLAKKTEALARQTEEFLAELLVFKSDEARADGTRMGIEVFRSEEKAAHKLLNEKLDLALELTEELVNDRRERVAKEAEEKARAEKKDAEEKA